LLPRHAEVAKEEIAFERPVARRKKEEPARSRDRHTKSALRDGSCDGRGIDGARVAARDELARGSDRLRPARRVHPRDDTELEEDEKRASDEASSGHSRERPARRHSRPARDQVRGPEEYDFLSQLSEKRDLRGGESARKKDRQTRGEDRARERLRRARVRPTVVTDLDGHTKREDAPVVEIVRHAVDKHELR